MSTLMVKEVSSNWLYCRSQLPLICYLLQMIIDVILHLLILVLQFIGFWQEGLLFRLGQIVPHFTKSLGYISNAQARILGLNTRPVVPTEQEKPWPETAKTKLSLSTLVTPQKTELLPVKAQKHIRWPPWSVRVLLLLPTLLSWVVAHHFLVITGLVLFGHVVKFRLLFGWHSLEENQFKMLHLFFSQGKLLCFDLWTNTSTYFPSLGALLGKLWEADIDARVLLVVFLTTRLHKISIGRHLAFRLSWFTFRHCCCATQISPHLDTDR